MDLIQEDFSLEGPHPTVVHLGLEGIWDSRWDHLAKAQWVVHHSARQDLAAHTWAPGPVQWAQIQQADRQWAPNKGQWVPALLGLTWDRPPDQVVQWVPWAREDCTGGHQDRPTDQVHKAQWVQAQCKEVQWAQDH